MDNKYGIQLNDALLVSNGKRLINQIWKLIPMKENMENWQDQLNTIIIEVAGLAEIFFYKIDYIILLSKLEGLKADICDDFMIYRKTVFKCIDLVAKLVKSYE